MRVGVPIALRGILGARELRQWLGPDRRAAERNAQAVIAEFYRRIDEAKLVLADSAPTIRSVAQAHYASELRIDDIERHSGSRAHIEYNALMAPRRAMLLRLLLADQLSAEEGEALMGWAVDQAMANGAAPATLDRAAVIKALAEVQLEAMARVEERDHGRVSPAQPGSKLLLPSETDDQTPGAVAATRRPRGTGDPLSALVHLFHAERTAGAGSMSENTMAEHKVAVRMLEEFLGAGTAARSITRNDMLAYKRALMRTPVNYRQRFAGKLLPDAITANAALAKPYSLLNPATINNKWLSHISTIMAWCANNGLLDDNPARGIRVDKGKGYKEPTRAPFTQDDLKRLFGSPMFLDPSTYGTRQWALLVSLYTGARSSSEVARIKLSDIYSEQGVLVFDLEEATKNVRSKRLVPVHEALLDLGIDRYIEKLRAEGRTLLFWDWEPEDKINRWFLRTYMPSVGIVDPRKVFHSFRHTLKTALARHGVNRDVSDMITGHKDQSVGGIYIGDAAVTMVKAMSEGLNRVTFDLGLILPLRR